MLLKHNNGVMHHLLADRSSTELAIDQNFPTMVPTKADVEKLTEKSPANRIFIF